MPKPREAFGKKILTLTMAGVSLACLGAAVIAAPVPVVQLPAIHMADLPHILQKVAFYRAPVSSGPAMMTGRSVAVAPKSSLASLGDGPALRLSKAGNDNEEDCVVVPQVTGPDGRIYVTRGLACSE